ncbi:MAG: TldD/PmbA family protein [Candidatus Delongbacteria bacterium]|nr:TldD/PmbA family protein [Candidatus Delongbacteria bacterium]
MEKLLNQIKDKFEQSEVFFSSSEDVSVTIANGKLDAIESNKESGYSVRTFHKGVAGFAYSNKISDTKPILESLDISLIGKVEGNVDLPDPADLPDLNTYNSQIEKVSSDSINDICEDLYKFIKNNVDAEITTSGWKSVTEKRLLNSKGVDYSGKSSSSGLYASIDYPGGGGSLNKVFKSKSTPEYCEKEISKLINMYKTGLNIVKPEGGKMKVLFMPNTVFSLIWRLYAAAKADAVDQGVSVLKEKIGDKIFSEKITIYNDPLNDEFPGAQAFDGEGVVNKRNYIVENGVFRSFYGDLKFCKKIGIEPTGGSARGSWRGQPSSSMSAMYVEPGEHSLEELIAMMDKGIIIFGVLGAHSGNIPNGDLSIGINPCFYVENGEIKGRVKDSMLAGNVYDIMKNVLAVGNKSESGYMVTSPPILLDNINIAIKQ